MLQLSCSILQLHCSYITIIIQLYWDRRRRTAPGGRKEHNSHITALLTSLETSLETCTGITAMLQLYYSYITAILQLYYCYITAI